jgi:hypothetical protein
LIDVRVGDGQLKIRLTGWDAFMFCVRWSWEHAVPVGQVVRVYAVPPEPTLFNVRNRTVGGGHTVRRVLPHRPSLWVDVSRDRYQRLAFSVPNAEGVAEQVVEAGGARQVRHSHPGPLTADDVARLSSGEFTRETEG